jgi:hypothetical protein
MNNPVVGFLKTIFLFIMKKVKFDNHEINKTITMPDGKEFTIFRRVNILSKKSEPKAYFIVRFKPMKMGIQQNIRFSVLPMMVFMGFKGFRSKYWAVDYETGLCQGLYEWQTVEDAENYSKSIAMKFMTRRSYPELLEYKIVDKSKEKLVYSIKNSTMNPNN